jgi:hypothetical protein
MAPATAATAGITIPASKTDTLSVVNDEEELDERTRR